MAENLEFLSAIDEKKDVLDDCLRFLWAHPELAFTEFESAAYLEDVLEKEGFRVEKNLAGIETAFSGTYGSGRPVIGFLGEYDALSGLSQKACALEPDPVEGWKTGHGCGHNMLGTATLASAIAVKRYLETTKKEGTVVYFGTPGEEGGSGKGFMARDGVFDGVDYVLTWHPGAVNRVFNHHSLGNYHVLYKFDGVSSHAGVSPHLGRSALDAAELMNVGVQFLREHISDDARIHYAFLDVGGISPNVVQSHAEVLYTIRGTSNAEVKELYERVNNIAEGAALMTGTKASHEFYKASSVTILNEPLQRVVDKWIHEIPVPHPSEEYLDFLRKLLPTMPNQKTVDYERPIHEQPLSYPPETQGHGSTDVGDVSWVCPTVQMGAATWAIGTPAHSWQAVTQGQSDWACEITRYTGKVLAASAVDVLEHPEILEEAKKVHRKLVGPNGYEPPIPKGVRPHPAKA